jgi:hypothetical protein
MMATVLTEVIDQDTQIGFHLPHKDPAFGFTIPLAEISLSSSLSKTLALGKLNIF